MDSSQKKPSTKEHLIQPHHTELTTPPSTITPQYNKNVNTTSQHSPVTHKHHNNVAEIQTPKPSTHPTPLRPHIDNDTITANSIEPPHAITNKSRNSESINHSQHEPSRECNSKPNTKPQRKIKEKATSN